MDMNTTCISGRVAFMNKLEYRNNRPFLRIGVSVRIGDKKGSDGKYPSILYPCHIWGEDAKNIAPFLFPGQVVSVNGSMGTFETIAKNTNKKATSWFLNVNRGGFHMHSFKEIKQEQPATPVAQGYTQQHISDPYSQFASTNRPQEQSQSSNNINNTFDPFDPDNLPF